jgi:transcription antitermination factor NusG
MPAEWYLIRTKAAEERKAVERLCRCTDERLLPLLQTRVQRWGKLVDTIVPLFTSYVFARFNISEKYNQVRHTAGVQYVVHFGDEFAVVPEWLVDELKKRSEHGPIAWSPPEFVSGEMIRVIDGPFRQFQGIFERRLSGPDRIAILLSAMGTGTRLVLTSGMIEKVS